MKIFSKNLLCSITFFLLCFVAQSVQPTPNFDALLGFETITQIPDHANPYAGMVLLHMMPAYLNALDTEKTAATKILLNHLFICPNQELDATHILPVTGEFQAAHFLTPELIGQMIATIDFFQTPIQNSDSQDDRKQKISELKNAILEKLNKELPKKSELLKKNRHFVDLVINSLEECGYSSLDTASTRLIPHFTSGALTAFLCLMSSNRESLQAYCVAYQDEKNKLSGTELQTQYPAIKIDTPKKRNALMLWNANKAVGGKSTFIESLITFLKSTYNEIAQIIEIPDIKTRGTRYPVCIETLLCNLVQFTLKSATFQGKPSEIIKFFKESQTEDLEQHIIDFSQLINNLPGVMYDKVITSDKIVYDIKKKNFDFNIEEFVHFGNNININKLNELFTNRKNFEILGEQHGVICIKLENRILGVYNPETMYGLALDSSIGNIVITLSKMLEIDLNVDSIRLLHDHKYAKETFDLLAPLVGWTESTQFKSEDYRTLRFSVTNNTGGLIVNLSPVHGYCMCGTQKERLRGKANAFSLQLFKAYCTNTEPQTAFKFLTLLTSLAPWNLAKLITIPASPNDPYAGIPGGGPIAARCSEIAEGLARHLYLGQEINKQNCIVSIVDILEDTTGYRFTDVINFLHKNIKNALSNKEKELLSTWLEKSSWIKDFPELQNKLSALAV